MKQLQPKKMCDMESSPSIGRIAAAHMANSSDADVWRWFSGLVDEERLIYCHANGVWLVTVDHRHQATNVSFDAAIREAKGGCQSTAIKEVSAREFHPSVEP